MQRHNYDVSCFLNKKCGSSCPGTPMYNLNQKGVEIDRKAKKQDLQIQILQDLICLPCLILVGFSGMAVISGVVSIWDR